MMGRVAWKKKQLPQDKYHNGLLTAEEFLDKLLNGKEGDRDRRRIEEKHHALFSSKNKNK